jgi:predicted ester cyclase
MPSDSHAGADDGSLRLSGLVRPMPRDYRIALPAKGGTDAQLLNPGRERRQPMRGFEAQYVDIVDYIVRITHRIWEEKNIGYIYDTYRHNARVVDDYGLQYGRDKIVADTVHTINAFPDIRLYADEIVWAGDDRVGFFTSHRTVIVGHNTGWSRYGPPTGKRVVVWCIANCVALENEIFEEWVQYNNGSLLRQLGFDLPQLARELRRAAPPPTLGNPAFGEVERVPGQGKPPYRPTSAGEAFDVDGVLRSAYQAIWNRRMLGLVDTLYAAQVRVHGATNREFYGRGAYKAFILSLLAMFPDGAFEIDDLYWMGNDDEGYLTALRWHFVGTHRGAGIYGPPTGRQITMWGITQQRIERRLIVEEWLLFNEFEIMQQLYAD